MQDIVITYDHLDVLRKWLQNQVGQREIKIDIGCGKDDFIVQAAKNETNTIYFGVENNAKMLWRLEKKVRRSEASNIRLLPFDAAFVLNQVLLPKMVSAFFIQFPDPWPKRRHCKRRVITRDFIDVMVKCLLPGGEIFYASDVAYAAENARMLFEDTMELVNTEGSWLKDRPHPWRTLYERKFLKEGKKIYYLKYIKIKDSYELRVTGF